MIKYIGVDFIGIPNTEIGDHLPTKSSRVDVSLTVVGIIFDVGFVLTSWLF